MYFPERKVFKFHQIYLSFELTICSCLATNNWQTITWPMFIMFYEDLKGSLDLNELIFHYNLKTYGSVMWVWVWVLVSILQTSFIKMVILWNQAIISTNGGVLLFIGHLGKKSMTSKSKCKDFSKQNSICKCCLQNCGHFFSPSLDVSIC